MGREIGRVRELEANIIRPRTIWLLGVIIPKILWSCLLREKNSLQSLWQSWCSRHHVGLQIEAFLSAAILGDSTQGHRGGLSLSQPGPTREKGRGRDDRGNTGIGPNWGMGNGVGQPRSTGQRGKGIGKKDGIQKGMV